MTLKLNVMAKTMPVSQNECYWSVGLSLRGKEGGKCKGGREKWHAGRKSNFVFSH